MENGHYTHVMTGEELASLKSVLIGMFDDLNETCKKHGIPVILCGGTALGAVRHHGFIPWDDDMDVTIPRVGYQKFLKIFEKELGDKYLLYAPNTPNGALGGFARLMKKGTRMVVDRYADSHFYKGVWIDINPLDGAPATKFGRRLVGVLLDFMRGVAGVSFWYRYGREMSTKLGGSERKLRLFLGRLVAFINPQKMYNAFDRFAAKKRSDKYLSIPTGKNYYYGESMPATMFFPVSKGIFEGREVMLPCDWDAYLTKLYGDYMQIPPPEKQIRHSVIEFNAD